VDNSPAILSTRHAVGVADICDLFSDPGFYGPQGQTPIWEDPM